MKTIRTKLLALDTAFCLALSLVGYGVSITGVSLESVPDTMERGSTCTATPEYTYDGETPESAKIEELVADLGLTFSSSDPGVIIVDDNGNMSAIGIGTAEVAVSDKDGKITSSKTVKVVVSPTAISMVDELTLSESNNVAVVNPTVEPEDATDVVITLTSSDENVVTVDSGAMEIHAVAEGEAVVTAAIEGTDLSAECAVTVLPSIETVELNKTSLTLAPESTDTLTYTYTPDNADASKASWTSSDEAVATVDESGNVTAVADGSATITVNVGGVEATCDVTVATRKTSSGSSGSTSSGSSGASSGSSGYTNTFDSDAASAGAFQTGALPLSESNGTGMWHYITSSYDAYWAVVNNINKIRQDAGLAALTCDSSQSEIENSRCDALISAEDFSHNGCMTSGEIMARTQYSAAQVCEDWKNSPSQYAAITTAGFTRMGVACWFGQGENDEYGTLWCVVFEY